MPVERQIKEVTHTMKYGLLGEKLSHSYSPELHALLGQKDYTLFEVAPEELESFMKTADFDGINVTVPYKKAVIPYLDSLSEEAKTAGSVNVIVKKEDGTLFGDNTDTAGFDAMLRFHNVKPEHKKVLILGSGGAAGAVRTVMERKGAECITVSRTGEVNYENVVLLHADADIIVNATPVGMYPENGKCPIDISPFENLFCVIDLIYNPERTVLVLSAEDRGIKAFGGMYMLAAQAALAEKIFTGREYGEKEIFRAYNTLRNKVRNIVFIGMPGSGKTVIGRRLAHILHRPFADVDSIIEASEGRSIPDILEKDGEEDFRRMETEYTAKTCQEKGQVISTGGGVVTREENRNLLRMNSVVIYLIRPTKSLTLRGRPISNSCPIEELAQERIPLYKKWADVKILNGGINPTIGEIIRFMHLKPAQTKERNGKNENPHN